MKKYIILIIVTILLMATFVGCSSNESKDVNKEEIETFDVNKAEDDIEVSALDRFLKNGGETTVYADTASKFELIDFYEISGIFSRNVMQEDIEILEMFALDINSFLRVAENELEREVYAYNYTSDDFTYLYYFAGELISKTILNVGTGNTIKDDEGYAEKLIVDAKELKEYFYSLLEIADISVSELEG